MRWLLLYDVRVLAWLNRLQNWIRIGMNLLLLLLLLGKCALKLLRLLVHHGLVSPSLLLLISLLYEWILLLLLRQYSLPKHVWLHVLLLLHHLLLIIIVIVKAKVTIMAGFSTLGAKLRLLLLLLLIPHFVVVIALNCVVATLGAGHAVVGLGREFIIIANGCCELFFLLGVLHLLGTSVIVHDLLVLVVLLVIRFFLLLNLFSLNNY